MSKRIVIVGGVAAGASAAAKARRMSEDVEIVLIEAGPYVSFANCGLPYHVGGEIAERDKLFVVSAKMLGKRFNLDVRVNTRAEAIDADKRIVRLTGSGGRDDELGYDRLILATGTLPLSPPIPGLDGEGVFTVRTVPDVDAIMSALSSASGSGPIRAAVVGGGYIGLETAEQLLGLGLKVTLIEMADQVLPGAMDAEMAQPAASALEAAGGEVVLGDALAQIVRRDGAAVAVTRSGREVACDICIVSLGVRPNVELAEAAGIRIGQTGAIQVDQFQRTSEASIYAAGDNSETRHLVLDRAVNIPLAGPANKAGRAAGANAALDLSGAGDDDPRRLTLRGVLGTAIARVGGAVVAVTGLTESAAAAEELDARVVYVPGTSHAGYYPGAAKMLLKLVYSAGSGRLLGAQAVGGEGVDKRIDVLATAIAGGMTVEDLEHLDLCYAPPFGSAKDIAIVAGFAASNVRRGLMPSMTPGELFAALDGPDAPVVIDVRQGDEFAAGHLDEAINLPLSELRDRIDDVPRDRPVAVHCLGGYRSYLAQRILLNHGYDNVRNVLGGYGLLRPQRG